MRLSEAVFQGQISRLRFSLLEAIFSCLFLLSGFCKRRFGSFCGCGFAGLGLESCCCLRLSEAVFQGQISRLRFSLLEAIFSWFCVTWARILLLFEAFGSGLPRSDFETKVFFAGGNLFLSLSFEWVLYATVRQFLWLRFCVTWARIPLLFEAFGSGLPRSDFETKVFFAGGNLFLSFSFEWVL